MYEVTQEVKEAFNREGSIKRGYLQVVPLSDEDPIILDEDDIKSFTILDDIYTPDYGVIGSIISKELTFDLFNPLDISLVDRELEAYIGVEDDDGNVLTYVPYGRYIIQKPETNDTTSQVISEAFDYMIKFNKSYENTIEDYENCTVLDIFNSICTQCSVEAGTTEFTNSTFQVTENLFTSGETCREVLTAIAQISGTYARIGRDNKIYLCSLEVQDDTTEAKAEFTDEEYDKLELNQVYGGVNRLVLNISDVEGENVTREDTEAQETDGLYELDITDNPFLYSEDLRILAIDVIWEKVKGLKYYDFTMTGISLPYLDCGDTIKINDTLTILLTHEVKYTGALKSDYSAVADTLSQTQYVYTPEMKNALKRTEIQVRKQSSEIEAIVSEQAEQTEKTNQILLDIDGLHTNFTSLDENLEELKSQTEQTASKLEYTISKANGNNLVKNSDMANGTEFWQAHLKAAFTESDTPPESPEEDEYWYCTANYDIYVANQMYKYTNGTWVESALTRKLLNNGLNLLQYTSSYETDESKLNTASGRYIRVDVDNDYPNASHSYNSTNLISIDTNEEYITMSIKVKNNIKLGNVMLLLAVLPNFELPTTENPSSMYEPAILITPDDYDNTLHQYSMTIKLPKKSEYISVVTGTTPPTDTTKYWLYELQTGIGVIMQFDGTNWVQYNTNAVVYEEDTNIIWTYRALYGAYYKTNFTSDLDFKSIVCVVAFYGGFALTSSTTAPDPQKGLYWLDTANNKCFRAKYNEEEFVEWEDTGLTATWVSQNIMPVVNTPFVPPKRLF